MPKLEEREIDIFSGDGLPGPEQMDEEMQARMGGPLRKRQKSGEIAPNYEKDFVPTERLPETDRHGNEIDEDKILQSIDYRRYLQKSREMRESFLRRKEKSGKILTFHVEPEKIDEKTKIVAGQRQQGGKKKKPIIETH